MEGLLPANHQLVKQHRHSPQKASAHLVSKQNQVGTVMLYGVPIVSLVIESQERLCLAQISNTLLKQFSYNEIHNRRVALGITCVQCTPVQLEILRRAGAMPVSSRRCGMITRREAERLCKSFLGDNAPPRLPDDFAFSVHHECAWGCRGAFLPSRYNSSRAKCIKCTFCGLFFSPNKFIFHSHRTSPSASYIQPDAANFNSWRRHMKLSGSPPESIVHAWEDVKAMFNGGTRKRMMSSSGQHNSSQRSDSSKSLALSSPSPSKQMKVDSPPATPLPYPPPATTPRPVPHRVPPFSDLSLPMSMMDYVWNGMDGTKAPFFSPYLPWFGSAKRSILGFPNIQSVVPHQETLLQQIAPLPHPSKLYHQSAFRPVYPALNLVDGDVTRKHLTSEIKRKPVFNATKRLAEDDERDTARSDEEDNPEVFLKREENENSCDSVDSMIRLKNMPINYKSCDKDYFNTDSEQMIGDKISELTPKSDRAVNSKIVWGGETKELAEDYSTKKRCGLGKPDEDEGLPNAEEDETVDIETTDDLDEISGHHSRQESSDGISSSHSVHDRAKMSGPPNGSSDEVEVSPVPEQQKQRIWTIARFSFEESNSRCPCDAREGNCSAVDDRKTTAEEQLPGEHTDGPTLNSRNSAVLS